MGMCGMLKEFNLGLSRALKLPQQPFEPPDVSLLEPVQQPRLMIERQWHDIR